jgi:hypothetical protein
MTTIPPSGNPEIDQLLDSLRAAGIPDDQLLPTLQARLAAATSDNPDWVTHCPKCSVLYNGALETCPENRRHSVHMSVLDANSPAFQTFRVSSLRRRTDI